ncbi:hypothetical protein ILUMI_07322 [Ignelater luminosus]|uniref:Protein downstream neighbor of son homolog n=1 Tax=Ignelater luminosus TaxID=2038154 RepID=A0A8K0D6Q4_IGNLU|nr:hypothetical protein ILUMI_07322 [Ignelater luminosus]
MNDNNSHTDNVETKWLHPNEVLRLQRLKLKKKQLQARIKPKQNSSQDNTNKQVFGSFVASATANKRTNPFVKNSENKRFRVNSIENEESSDQTLFKLLNLSETNSSVNGISQPTTFTNVLKASQEPEKKSEAVDIGKPWIPIDWALKSKVRLMSSKAFAWNQKLKVSEEASGITAFVRCLDNNSETTVDTSSNAKFHQCCLYWQYPFLPWLNLFPRSTNNTSKETSIASTSTIRESLQKSWCDSLRSLFQLVRTRQCPYFYVCTNNFTVIFRAAGICGYTEMNAIITPTTRGFRQLLKQEDIDFIMPLKSRRTSDQMQDGNDTTETVESAAAEEDEGADEKWLQSMGINAEDIKQINYTQARISQKTECEIDSSEQSLVFIEGMEVNGLYNFLLNTKSVTNATGPLAGIPPTLLSQVAFQGGTLCALKVKESKVRIDEVNYFSLEITGPVLPHLIHNLCALHPADQNLIATFANLNSTLAFNKIKVVENSQKENQSTSGFNVFGEMNLSDCGLNPTILKHFCSSNIEHICNIESIKYNVETKTYILGSNLF